MILVYITCKDKEESIRIGKSLITSRLAGCINILKEMTSIYEWEGKLEIAEEVVLIAKTNESLLEEIITKVKKDHSYAVPCILSIPIQNGNSDYMNWIKAGTKNE